MAGGAGSQSLLLIYDRFFGLFQRGSKGLQFLLQRSDFLLRVIPLREGQMAAQHLDLPAYIGLGLIIAGVVVINVFSDAVKH